MKNQKKIEEAVRSLVSWIGDDPSRIELKETPARVATFFKDFFIGYKEDPLKILTPLPEKSKFNNQMILLKGIEFSSYCEHHIAPMIGKVYIAYVPNEKLVGLSKIGKCIRVITGKLQLQERICDDIVKCMNHALQPKGVAVIVVATHYCMIAPRGNKVSGGIVETTVSSKTGVFVEDSSLYSQFLSQLNLSS